MFLESRWADQKGNTGKVGIVEKVGKVLKIEHLG